MAGGRGMLTGSAARVSGAAVGAAGGHARVAAVRPAALFCLALAALGLSLPALLELHGSALLVAMFALPAMIATRAYPPRAPSVARLNILTALAFGLILLDGGEVAAWAGAASCLAAPALPGAARRGRAEAFVATARAALAASVSGAVLAAVGGTMPLFSSPVGGVATVLAALAYIAVDATVLYAAGPGALEVGGGRARDAGASPRQVIGQYVVLLSFGVVLAGLYAYVPFIMPLLLFPLSVLYLVLRSTASAQADTRHAFESLADEVDRRSVATAGHSQRVAVFAERCAAAMPGLAPWERQLIVWSARIHDIGNKYVAPSLADRDGPLDDWERDEVERHAWYGASLLASTPGFRQAATIIRHHHENLDGTGYPDHLRGGQIPVGSRIIRVAESLDAMLSYRAYRPAYSFEAAADELRDRAGSWFDPVVVETMLSRVTPSDIALAARNATGAAGALAVGSGERGTRPARSASRGPAS